MQLWRNTNVFLTLSSCLFLLLANTALAERENEFTSPIPGPGTSTFPLDETIPFNGIAPSDFDDQKENVIRNAIIEELGGAKILPSDTIVGDDVPVDQNAFFEDSEGIVISNA